MIGKARVLMIDHFDSFVNLLADEFRRRDTHVDVVRSDCSLETVLQYMARQRPQLVVLSPGPGHPRDHVLTMALLGRTHDTPIFGVCLGHQCIVEHCGGTVRRARRAVHGRFGRCSHDGDGLFAGLPNPLQVGRYHSLVADDLPPALQCDAECEGEIMALHHRTRPMWGVQFHPESILTPRGSRVIDNLLGLLEVQHVH